MRAYPAIAGGMVYVRNDDTLVCLDLRESDRALPAFCCSLAQSPQAILNRAVADFENGRFAESAAAFDSLAKAVPDQAPYLWQRGIALYYAGRYDDCRRQFESHRAVNPDDVENAAWHFLCVARAESPAKARAALLPVGPDARVPMREVYQMFRGTLTPEQVLSAAGSAARRRSSSDISTWVCTSKRWG